MKRLSFSALAAALLLTTAAFAEPQMVSKVEVAVNSNAIDNAKATDYLNQLSSDLNAAIMTKLGDNITEGGAVVMVNVAQVELANSYQELIGVADSRLVGDVAVRAADSDVDLKNYQLTVSFADAGAFFPEGTDIAAVTWDSPLYYTAMVDAFADRVVANLQ
jgi:hypothetical protein